MVSYGEGVFTISGTASSASGVRSVEITAQIDGIATDLGSATIGVDGIFNFADVIGRSTQGLITATETDAAGGTASGRADYSLTGKGHGGEQDVYDVESGAPLSRTTFQNDGASVTDILAPNQNVVLQPSGVAANHRRAGTVFVYAPGSESSVVDVIKGFKLSGSGHDTIALPSSDFTNFAAVLRNTGDVGGSAFITDPKTGDAIRLAGVNTAELKAHPKDFVFA